MERKAIHKVFIVITDNQSFYVIIIIVLPFSEITITVQDRSRVSFIGPEDAFITIYYHVMK